MCGRWNLVRAMRRSALHISTCHRFLVRDVHAAVGTLRRPSEVFEDCRFMRAQNAQGRTGSLDIGRQNLRVQSCTYGVVRCYLY